MISDGGAARDSGFTLVEALVGFLMFSVVMTAVVPLLVGVLQSSTAQGSQQTAQTVASAQLEYIRSITPLSLVRGRAPADVAALIADPGLVDLSGDDTAATANSDPTASAGSAGAVVRLTGTQTVNKVVYTLRSYVNVCYLSGATGLCTATSTNGPMAYRVSLDVTWPRLTGGRCASGRSGQCEVVVTTLIDLSDDPGFTLAAPPTITGLYDATGSLVPLTVLHPGQQVRLVVQGANFAAGTTVYSHSGDVVGVVTGTGTTSLSMQLRASQTLGGRSFVVVNADGSNVTTTITVAQSAPTITGISPNTATRAVARTFTVSGSDFFATPTSAAPATRPGVSMSWTAPALLLPLLPTTGSNVTVSSAGQLTFSATFPTSAGGYVATGTLQVTDPDGGTASQAVSVTVS